MEYESFYINYYIHIISSVGFLFPPFFSFIKAKLQTDLQNKWANSIHRDIEHQDFRKSVNN